MVRPCRLGSDWQVIGTSTTQLSMNPPLQQPSHTRRAMSPDTPTATSPTGGSPHAEDTRMLREELQRDDADLEAMELMTLSGLNRMALPESDGLW